MKQFNSPFIRLTGLALITLIPDTLLAVDSWTGFVPPVSSQFHIETTGATEKWHKVRWRSGANFKTINDHRFNNNTSNIIDAKEYAQTQPKRKSVNPWTVNRFTNKRYKFGPTIRPWGSVPEKFQKRSTNNVAYRMQPAGNNFVAPPPVYRPYMNNSVFNRSNSLIPIGGYPPIYTNPGYMNYQPYFGSPYGYPNTYAWR